MGGGRVFPLTTEMAREKDILGVHLGYCLPSEFLKILSILSPGYRGNLSCKTVLQLDKFAPYEAAEKDHLLERRFQDITNDYDKSPPPTASTTPTHYPSLNSIIFENGCAGNLGDLNGNTKADSLCGGLPRSGSGLGGNPGSGGHLISNLTAGHNMSAVGSFPIDAKMLQFSTDQVRFF